MVVCCLRSFSGEEAIEEVAMKDMLIEERLRDGIFMFEYWLLSVFLKFPVSKR